MRRASSFAPRASRWNKISREPRRFFILLVVVVVVVVVVVKFVLIREQSAGRTFPGAIRGRRVSAFYKLMRPGLSISVRRPIFRRFSRRVRARARA